MLKKLTILGDKYFHIFEDVNGNKTKVYVSEKEVTDVFKNIVTAPVYKDLIYQGSFKAIEYDTESGNIEDNCYVEDDGGDGYLVKLTGYMAFLVDKSEIINSVLSQEMIDKIKLMGKLEIPQNLTVIRL